MDRRVETSIQQHKLEREQRRKQKLEGFRLEQEKNMNLLVQSLNLPPAAAPMSANNVPRLIISYLSPDPQPDCRGVEQLAHMRCLLNLAAVNHQWRAVAFPMFYRTVLVVIGSWPKASDGSVKVKLRTNIDLLHAAGQTSNAREVQIIVQGAGRTASELHDQLKLAGLSGEPPWPAIERLRIDMRDSSRVTQTDSKDMSGKKALTALNDFLSKMFPLLREIEYYGYNSIANYKRVPFEQLIKERLYGAVPLRAVRVKADCWPKLTDDYERYSSAPPIRIECLEVEGPDKKYIMPTPLIMADTLVRLKLDPADEECVWLPFVSEDTPEAHSNHVDFSSLKSLVLVNSDKGFELNFKPMAPDIFDLLDGEWNLSDVGDAHLMCYSNMPRFDIPTFPVLTSLDLRDMRDCLEHNFDIYAASPITSLQLCAEKFCEKGELDLSVFRYLRTLSIRVTLDKKVGKNMCASTGLSDLLPTVCPNLRHLTLAMNVNKESCILFAAPPFADSLTSLVLEGEYGQRDVEHMLLLLPNLRKLDVCAIVSSPIFSVPDLVDRYLYVNTIQSLTPLNPSLRSLSAYGIRYFTGFDGHKCVPESKRLMAPELNHYRGLLVGLVCRLPALDMLRVGAKSIDGVNESIKAVVATNVGLEHIGHLPCLRVRPLN